MFTESLDTACCVVGGGPAGAMLGLLLARAGVDVTVLEKHTDFLRDFRGDTIHPATLELLDQLGLADRFLALPHTRARELRMRTEMGESLVVDFSRLPTRFPYLAFVPQWDFLDFLVAEARQYPTFHLRMQAEVTDLLVEGGTVRGVQYRDATDGTAHTLRAALVVGADGRGSRTREAAGLPMARSDPPMDVLWFRLSRRPDEPQDVDARVGNGHFLVVINRASYWQIALTIPKGTLEQVQANGLPALRATIARLVPEMADRVAELQTWDDVKLLSVQADHLRRWYRPGYLAIGDAAHAMSPVAGVGINAAIQDAVTAANLLWWPLSRGAVSTSTLARVQRQRQLSVRLIQAFQGMLQARLLSPLLAGGENAPFHLPTALVLAFQMPGLRTLPGRLVGLGVLRPRVRSPLRAQLPPAQQA